LTPQAIAIFLFQVKFRQTNVLESADEKSWKIMTGGALREAPTYFSEMGL